MKVVVLGGPQDGREWDIPNGSRTFQFPRAITPIGLRELTNPFLDERMTPDEVYVVRRVRHAETGRDRLMLVAPRMNDWLTKNFTDKGK